MNPVVKAEGLVESIGKTSSLCNNHLIIKHALSRLENLGLDERERKREGEIIAPICSLQMGINKTSIFIICIFA